ncbi:magnesium transporter CorA [Allopusillimonas soli]|uniref:Magnesium transporter CorA family protein n=1 Tax=Allopusillimonas soli TaxID=659016 RepID=A0A853FM50_9BURK|nr:magnesium transporter CorA family protein [Allopusillimonas soli]NYT38976.1 magnesium transporter CorA family protein [Allopusillimonas soli]TEA69579.1 magnesium transporter CorA [Allopusillimonas soli]
MSSARIILIRPERKTIETLDEPPESMPQDGFIWMACDRDTFSREPDVVQGLLARWTGGRLLELHVSDLLNANSPSQFDFTSRYEMLVFRRLADNQFETGTDAAPAANAKNDRSASKSNPLPAARKAQTLPVGFVVFEKVLLSVHPPGCSVLEAYSRRLDQLASRELEAAGAAPSGPTRLPDAPAELMLRIVSQMVDAYLDLRKTMTRQLDHWQQRLLRPNIYFDNWDGLLKARQSLHHLYDICEDQHNALDRWMDVLEDLPAPDTPDAQHEHDQLLVRSRDILEHIERVSHHVRQLERSAETAIQIHFNIQNNRTNDVMRMLTAITAIFLPLNLIAGIFGMNFQFTPWLHTKLGFWGTLAVMLLIAITLVAFFARKRYLSSSKLD